MSKHGAAEVIDPTIQGAGTGRMPVSSRQNQQAEIKITETSLVLALEDIRQRSPEAFKNLVALRNFIDKSNGSVFSKKDLNDFIMECSQPLVYENQGETAHCVPGGEIQHALRNAESLAYLTGKVLELVKSYESQKGDDKTGTASLRDGTVISLKTSDLAEDAESKMGFPKRSKFERMLQRSLARAFGADNTGIYDNEIAQMRDAIRGGTTVQVFNDPNNPQNFAQLFTRDKAIEGASFSIRWLQNNGTHAYHYVVLDHVERDATGNPTKVFFHQTWGPQGIVYGPERKYHYAGAMNGLESMSFDEFKNLARIGFVDKNAVQQAGLDVQESKDPRAQTTPTGFEAESFRTGRPARGIVTFASTTGTEKFLEERSKGRFDFQVPTGRPIQQPTAHNSEVYQNAQPQQTISKTQIDLMEQMTQVELKETPVKKRKIIGVLENPNSLQSIYGGLNPRALTSQSLSETVGFS